MSVLVLFILIKEGKFNFDINVLYIVVGVELL